MSARNHFDYNLIKTLVLVFETRSMGKAAAALGVSSSTLTYSLNKIRDYYNDPLFVKTAHGFKVTSVANQIYPLFKKIDEDIGRATDIDKEKMHDSGDLIIRTNTLVEYYIMSEFLKNKDFFDGINFEFNNAIMTDEQRINALISRCVDIDIGPSIRKENTLICRSLFSSGFVAICSCHHPRIGDELTKEQWLAEEHTTLPMMKNATYLPAIFQELAVERKVRYRTTSLVNIFHCLEKSEMVMIIPVCFIAIISENFKLRRVETPWLSNEFLSLYAYTHSRSIDDERSSTIIDMLSKL